MKSIYTLISIILFLVLLVASSCDNNKLSVDKEPYKNEYTFIDTTNVCVTYLYQGKYIIKFQLVVDSVGNELQSMASTTVGQYKIIQDTLNINFPDFKSAEFKSMKTKYFWVDSTDNRGYHMNFLLTSEKIIDSVLGKKFDNYADMESVYDGAKAIIKNDKLIFFDRDLKETKE